MLRKMILSGAIAASAAVAVLPSAASAQNFGFAISSGPGYYYRPDYYGRYYDERRDAWLAHRRWEDRRRWEREDRRRYWDHERWENRGWRGW
jgi:hypothetical protein